MTKKIKYLIMSVIFATMMLCFVKVSTFAESETTEVDKFINNIEDAYDYYAVYDYAGTLSSDFELVIVEGSVENDMSLSIYYYPYVTSVNKKIFIEYDSGKIVEYTTKNGSELYNYSYDITDKIKINVYDEAGKVVKFSYRLNYYTNAELEGSSAKINGNGTHSFPKSTMINEMSIQKGCLATISVIGIFIAGILAIIIGVMLATKNTNIRREKRPTIYYVPRNINNINSQYQDVNNEDTSEQIIINEPVEDIKEPISEEDELKRLYTLHAKKEITDEELETLLRKYRGKRDDD